MAEWLNIGINSNALAISHKPSAMSRYCEVAGAMPLIVIFSTVQVEQSPL